MFENNFNISINSTNISGYIISSDNPKYIFQLVHGMAEHKERYYNFMRYICKSNDIACVIHDNRGHGSSVSKTEDLGYIGENATYNIVNDISIVQKSVQKYIQKRFNSNTNLPVILFGHSMGSLIVRCYAQLYDDSLYGLIICGSPSYNAVANVALLLTKSISKIKSDRYKSEFLNELILGKQNRSFSNDNTKEKNLWLSKNIDNVREYNNDPLCGFMFTCNGFECLLNLLKNAYNPDLYLINNLNLPILLISGKDDPCLDSKSSFYDIYNFIKKLGYKNTDTKLYNNMRHEILNETNKEKVYNDIINFIENIV